MGTTTVYVLLIAITMAMPDGTNCQLAALARFLPEIITLLENVTDLDWQQNLQNTQNQIANSQNQTASTLTQMANTQTQMKDTLIQMANYQFQMTNTQTQMASTMNQVASLLQMQSLQLQNLTATMTTVVSLLENQQGTLENISHTLPVLLKQQENQITLLGSLPSATPSTIPPATVPATGIPSTAIPSTAIPPSDCSDVAAQGYNTSRPYTVTPQDGMGSLTVYCDLQTADGGWTVFQRRFDGSVDFYRGWNEYEQGFGSPDGEHWMSLREIHRLTRNGRWTLRIDMENFDGTTEYAEYESFQLGDAASHYTLSIGSYSGNGQDRLSYHNNHPFSTKDRDHDAWSFANCAQDFQGAWWYNSCHHSNLNGLYLGPSGNSGTGMVWYGPASKKKTEIKIRRIQ